MAENKILITGASGMLGTALAKNWEEKFDIYATDKKIFQDSPTELFFAFDLLDDSYDVLLKWAEPDCIVHCAAITNVDYCEEYPEEATKVNGESVKKLLKSDVNARLIFISTDAVFPDGVHMATEKDKTGSDNVYGKSKELGEKYIMEEDGLHSVIRTTIVGKNINPSNQGFVEWIISSLKNRKEIVLFDDVLFTPITIWHLAEELEWVIRNDIGGIVHIAGKNAITKYEFGMSLCEKLGLDKRLIKKDRVDNFNFKAKRSKDQTMDSSHYESISQRNLPTNEDTIDLLAKHFEKYAYG